MEFNGPINTALNQKPCKHWHRGQQESSSKWAVLYEISSWVITSKATVDTLLCVHSNFHPKNQDKPWVVESWNHVSDGTSKNLHLPPCQIKSRSSKLFPGYVSSPGEFWVSLSEGYCPHWAGHSANNSQRLFFFCVKSDFPIFQLVLNAPCL